MRTRMVLALGVLVSIGGCRRAPAPAVAPANPPVSTPTAPPEHAPPVDAFATVGDVDIARAEFDALLAASLALDVELGRETPQSELQRHRRTIASRLVRESRLAQACRAANITIDPGDVTERIDKATEGTDFAEYLLLHRETEASLRATHEAALCEAALLPAIEITEEEIAAWARDHPGIVASEGWVRFTTAMPRGALPPICEHYLASYRRCVETKAPESVRGDMRGALEAIERAWREAVEGPARDGLLTACAAALDAARVGTKPFGCTFERPPRDRGVRLLPSTKKKLAALRIAASKPGADFIAIANAAGFLTDVASEPTPLELCDPKVRSTLARLQPGQVSAPIVVAEQYQVVQLIERLPPGHLPLTHARERIARGLRAMKQVQSIHHLYEELERRYPVQLHIAVDLPAGPDAAGHPERI